MILPASVSAALALPDVRPELWLEIEGVPWAFGMATHDATFFSGRAAAYQRLGVKGLVQAVPAGVDQEASPLEGDCSIGTMTVDIVDDDSGAVLALVANVARRDLVLTLSADLAANATDIATLTVSGTPDASAYPAGGGTFYCGRETFIYASRSGSVFSTVKRAQYQIPGRVTYCAHTAGDWITPFPRFSRTRRAAIFATFDGTDTNRIARWGGTIAKVSMLDNLCGVRVDLDSTEAELKVSVFGAQRTMKLAVGLLAYSDQTGTEYTRAEGEPPPVGTSTTGMYLQVDPLSLNALGSGSGSGAAWVDQTPVVIRVGDEYVGGRLRTASGHENRIEFDGSVASDGRGLFNTEVAEHHPGDDVKEVLVIHRHDASGTAEQVASKFSGGNHPLEILLQLLASRSGDGANGTWDTLPWGWGIGIDQTMVDVAGIIALRDQWLGGAAEINVIEEPTELKAWIADLLKPHGCYLAPTTDGRISVRRMNPPIPGATPRTIDVTAVVATPSWSTDDEVIGRLIMRCDYNPGNSSTEKTPFRQTYTSEFQGPGTEAQEFYTGVFQTIEIESKGQWSGNDSVAAPFGVGLSTAADVVALRLSNIIRDRYSKPFPTIGVQCSYDYLDVEVGDLVALSLDNLPDVSAGARGLAGTICEVKRKTIDDARGIVTLELLQTAYAQQARLIAPCATVASAASNVLTCNAHDFTSSAGAADATSFVAGDAVAVWSTNLLTKRGSTTVQSQTGNTVTLAAAISGVTAGDVLMLDDYSAQPATRRAKSASLCDSSGLLGSDQAHEFAN